MDFRSYKNSIKFIYPFEPVLPFSFDLPSLYPHWGSLTMLPVIFFRFFFGQVDEPNLVTSWWLNQTHLKKMLVNMEIFPKVRDENKTCLSCHHPAKESIGILFVGDSPQKTCLFEPRWFFFSSDWTHLCLEWRSKNKRLVKLIWQELWMVNLPR